jgi:hypothetical protein
VARYLGTHGSERISRALFLGAVPPFLLTTDDHPQGVFQRGVDAIRTDQHAYLTSFYADFSRRDVAARPIEPPRGSFSRSPGHSRSSGGCPRP